VFGWPVVKLDLEDKLMNLILVKEEIILYLKLKEFIKASIISHMRQMTSVLGAIQIIRDTFLAYFRPPLALCHLVTLAQTHPPV